MMPLVELVRTEATDDVTLATAGAVTKALAQARRARRRRAGVRRQPRPDADDLRADAGARARHSVAETSTRRSSGSACRWRRPSSSSWWGRASPTTSSRRSTARSPSGSRSRRPSPITRTGGRTPDRRRRAVVDRRDHERAMDAVADEIAAHLADGVVPSAADVDTCLLLGAGFPFWLGGVTKHLDQKGISQRLFGRPLAERAPGRSPDGRRRLPRPHHL